MYSKTWLALLFGSLAAADLLPIPTPAPTGHPVKRAEDAITAISDCHMDGEELHCVAGDQGFHVQTTPSQTTDLPAQFTGCHPHGADLYCFSPDGEDIEAIPVNNDEEHCHFHAGVEHCGDHGSDEEVNCERQDRDYNVGLRVGLLFVILVTSALGVFVPIVLEKWMPNKLNLAFVVLKQFGTGIIISTALIHLYTHAQMMFSNPCIGRLEYEGVTSAIVTAGIFLSFLVEYTGQRFVSAKIRKESAMTAKERGNAVLSSEVTNIIVMEIGILFHSLLIGLTLVVAGDSFFITLFIVILFHQIFEGIALGSRIATIGSAGTAVAAAAAAAAAAGTPSHDSADKTANLGEGEASSMSSLSVHPTFSMKKKLGLASLFAFITPVGMAIGIGVLDHFNGQDRSTLIAIGTLDALSAGILLWVGLVEMWAGDWMTGMHGHKAELADASFLTVALGGFGLVTGLVLMSVLGKWA